jgi:hypothetical protein
MKMLRPIAPVLPVTLFLVTAAPSCPPTTASVTVTVSGPGRVTSSPAGIDCGGGGTTCSATFTAPAVTLTADAGVTVRWGGDCAGNGACTLETGGAHAVTAATWAPLVIPFLDGRPGGAERVAATGADNILGVGTIEHMFTRDNIWSRGYSPTGTPVWSNEYSGLDASPDAGRGVAGDGAGNAYVVGHWYSHTNTRFNWFVRKLSPAGAALWTRIGETIVDHDELLAVDLDASGNVIVAGYQPDAGGGRQAVLRKLDTAGLDVWGRTHDGSGPGADVANAVAVHAGGTILVAGAEANTGQGLDAWLAAYDGAGALLWTASHDGAGGDDLLRDVATSAAGIVAVAGREGADGYLAVHALDGTLLWSQVTAVPGGWTGVAVAPGGDVVVTSADTVARYTSAGALIWSRAGGGSDVAFDGGGNLLVAAGDALVKLFQ